MKKQLPLFVATLATLFITLGASAQGGKDRTAVVSLQAEYDIVIDHAYNRDCPYYGLSSHYFDGEHLVAEGIKWASQQYLKYNVTDSVLLDSVSLKVRPHSQIDDYCFLDRNTVLVAANPSYERDLHDGILFWVDRNQRIVDTVSLYDFPVKTSRRPDITDPERMFVSYFRFPLVCKQDKIAVPMLHWGHSFPGVPNDSVIGIIDLKNHHASRLPIAPPAAPEGHYWGYHYNYPRGLDADDHLFIFFGSSPLLYKYNLKTGEIASCTVPFETIGEIQPYQLTEDNPQFDPYRSQFEELFYDSRHKQLYWTAKVNCDTTDGPFATQYVNYLYSFVILDENMHKIGEGILPEGYGHEIIPYKEGFLLFKRNQPQLTYTYFTYSIAKGDGATLKEQIKERREKYNLDYPNLPKGKAFSNYIRKIIGARYAYFERFVIIPAASCPSCVPAYQQLLKKNRSSFLKNKTAVILINNNPSQINEFFEALEETRDANELKINKIPVYCDTTNEYRYYFNEWINLRCIELDSNKENILFDKIVNPSNLMDLDDFLRKED
jgi:hypothetical protein